MKNDGAVQCLLTVIVVLLQVIDFASAGRHCTTGGTPVFPEFQYCITGCCGERYNGYCCSETSVGGIMGGILGGALFLSILAAVLCWYQKRHSQRRLVEPAVGESTDSSGNEWYPAERTSSVERDENPVPKSPVQRTSDHTVTESEFTKLC